MPFISGTMGHSLFSCDIKKKARSESVIHLHCQDLLGGEHQSVFPSCLNNLLLLKGGHCGCWRLATLVGRNTALLNEALICTESHVVHFNTVI